MTSLRNNYICLESTRTINLATFPRFYKVPLSKFEANRLSYDRTNKQTEITTLCIYIQNFHYNFI